MHYFHGLDDLPFGMVRLSWEKSCCELTIQCTATFGVLETFWFCGTAPIPSPHPKKIMPLVLEACRNVLASYVYFNYAPYKHVLIFFKFMHFYSHWFSGSSFTEREGKKFPESSFKLMFYLCVYLFCFHVLLISGRYNFLGDVSAVWKGNSLGIYCKPKFSWLDTCVFREIRKTKLFECRFTVPVKVCKLSTRKLFFTYIHIYTHKFISTSHFKGFLAN